MKKILTQWSKHLLHTVAIKNPSIDFISGDPLIKVIYRRGIYYIDFVRMRPDKLYDRIVCDYEYYQVRPDFSRRFTIIPSDGWLVGVQYAISTLEQCPIPAIVHGGYCNLCDLFEYNESSALRFTHLGAYFLGEESPELMHRLDDLGSFLATTIPHFIDDIKVSGVLGL